jgi:hypothetical protein
MKFIEVTDGVSIRIDRIEKVERVDDLNSRITSGFDSYTMAMPYKTVLNIINYVERPEISDPNSRILKEISKKIGNLPVFAG